MANRRRYCQKKSSRGVTAIEFALTFPILFGLFYIVISYTFPLLIMQALHEAAAEGSRSAVKVAIDCEEGVSNTECQDNYEQQIESTASSAAAASISWLQPLSNNQIMVDANYDGGLLEVEVEYPGYSTNPPIPTLGNLLYFSQEFPPLPERLYSMASIRL